MQRRRVSLVVTLAVALVVSGCGPDDPYEDFPDRGDPETVAAVRDAVHDLVEVENAVGRLVLSEDGSLAAGLNTSLAAIERRRGELDEVATPSRARSELAVINAEIIELVDAPADAAQLGYTHADFTIDSFAGIAVDGAEATVVLRGTECYRLLSGVEPCDPPSDFRFELHATSDGRWVIATKTSRFLPGQGP